MAIYLHRRDDGKLSLSAQSVSGEVHAQINFTLEDLEELYVKIGNILASPQRRENRSTNTAVLPIRVNAPAPVPVSQTAAGG